jgi:hypothetical protein
MRFTRVTKSVADWLAEAADYLEQHGWWKGALRGPNGQQACSLGAILFSQGLTERDARYADSADAERIQQVCAALIRAMPEEYQGFSDPTVAVNVVTNWNDDGDRHKQEVLDTFRKAEKIERAGFDPDEGRTA